MPSKLIIISGPSGAGKSTLVRYLLEKTEFNLVFSISATSRKMREDEQNGKDYHFISIDQFKAKIEDNEFLEWEEVYPKQYYGTLKIEVEKTRSTGKNIIFDIDVVGALNIRRYYKDNSIAVFIQPPSVEELETRLKKRKTESDDSITKRMRKVRMELNYAKKFEHIVINDNLDQCMKETEAIVKEFITGD